jgi:hypothetical protein
VTAPDDKHTPDRQSDASESHFNLHSLPGLKANAMHFSTGCCGRSTMCGTCCVVVGQTVAKETCLGHEQKRGQGSGLLVPGMQEGMECERSPTRRPCPARSANDRTQTRCEVHSSLIRRLIANSVAVRPLRFSPPGRARQIRASPLN